MEQAMRILTVDDEPAVAQSLLFVLSEPGREVASALSGHEALEMIAARDFDMVITDNNMPGISGLELVQRLRELNFAGKILVLSAHLSTDTRGAYADLEVDEMMAKPFDVRELRRTIDKVASAA